MQTFLDTAIPLVRAFFDSSYANMPRPAGVVYISPGQTSESACGTEDERTYAYCPGDDVVYIGQSFLWDLYQLFGAAGPIVGLAHEWGHHVQSEVGVPEPDPSVPNDSIPHENQADCIAGAWVDYADKNGLIQYPTDIVNVANLLATIGEAEGPNQVHGTPSARERSFDLGFTQGLTVCNQFSHHPGDLLGSSKAPRGFTNVASYSIAAAVSGETHGGACRVVQTCSSKSWNHIAPSHSPFS